MLVSYIRDSFMIFCAPEDVGSSTSPTLLSAAYTECLVGTG